LSEDITPKDYKKFITKYPQFAQIGIENLGPKIWILFNTLRDNSVSITSITHRPCASLMENNVSFANIGHILADLSQSDMLISNGQNPPTYQLDDEIAYSLQQLSFDLTRNLPSSGEEMTKLLQSCGYSSEFLSDRALTPLFSDDNNVKTSKFRDLLAEVAFSGLRLIIKLLNRAEDSIE